MILIFNVLTFYKADNKKNRSKNDRLFIVCVYFNLKTE